MYWLSTGTEHDIVKFEYEEITFLSVFFFTENVKSNHILSVTPNIGKSSFDYVFFSYWPKYFLRDFNQIYRAFPLSLVFFWFGFNPHPAEFRKWNNPPYIFCTVHYHFMGYQDGISRWKLKVGQPTV